MVSTLREPSRAAVGDWRERAAREVTIVIPAFRNLPFLPAAIESALDAPAASVLIADDASGPEEQRVFARFQEKHGARLRVGRSDTQRGIQTNLNEAIRRVRTPFFVRLDCDDVLYPGHLENAFRLMAERPSLALVAGREHRISAEDCLDFKRFGIPEYRPDPNPRILFGQEAFRFAIAWNPNPCSSGTMYRKAAFDDAGGFNPNVVWGEDWEIWFRFAQRWDMAHVDAPAALYRIHDGATTSLYVREERICYGYDWMYRRAVKLCSYPELRPQLRRALLRTARLYGGAAWRLGARRPWRSAACCGRSALSFLAAWRA